MFNFSEENPKGTSFLQVLSVAHCHGIGGSEGPKNQNVLDLMQFSETLTKTYPGVAPSPIPLLKNFLDLTRIRIKMGRGDYGPTILKIVHKQKSPLPTEFLNLKSPRNHGGRSNPRSTGTND